ncbi:MAG: GAF domain-containing protein [Anaerolineae bacterium]|nr:GAF domain-containing protein [Anaerolineae bacterium]
MRGRFLRRFSVRQRVYLELAILVLVIALSLGLIIVNRNTLLSNFGVFINQDAAGDRALLSASVRVASSRVNLLRYTTDVVPSSYEALDDVELAVALLGEARQLVSDSAQQDDIALVIEALGEYQSLIDEIQAARTAGQFQQATRLENQAQRLGYDIGSRIELIVRQSQTRVTDTYQALQRDAQQRLVVLLVVYGVVIAVAVFIAIRVERSITQPISVLREGAEALQSGNLDTVISASGFDEFAVLARTFNEMASRLGASYRALELRVADRTRDLEQRADYLQAAVDVGRAATQILDVSELLRQSVEIVRRRFDLYYVGLFLTDAAGEWAVLQAGTGAAGQAMLARGHRIRVGSGMVGWSIARDQSRVAQEADADFVRQRTTELPETRSEAAIPLRVRDRVIGALTVQDDKPDIFDAASVATLQVVADQLAIALDNARLFAERERALAATERTFVDLARRGWAQLISSRPTWGYAAVVGGRVEPVLGGWPPDMLQAADTEKPAYADAGNTAAIPIKARDQVVGVVRLQKSEGETAWQVGELALIQDMLEQLGVALESARLYGETQRRAAQEQAARQITDRLRRAVDMDALMRIAVEEIASALDAPTAFVQFKAPGEERDDSTPTM